MEINFDDFDDKIQYTPGTEHICRGPNACENKQFDEKDKECQGCLEDQEQALRELGYD